MKKLCVMFLALFAINTLCHAQNLFTKIYESPKSVYARDLCETRDKGYTMIADIGSSQNQGQIYVIKTNQLGDTLWTKSIGSMEYDIGFSIEQTNDNGYIIAGMTGTSIEIGKGVYLVKISENGEVTWTKTFGGTSAQRVKITDDKGFIILGYTTLGVNNSWGNVCLIKTDLNGDTIWTRTPSCGSTGSFGIDLCITKDRGYLLAGITSGDKENESGHVFLIKTDSKGDKVWSKIYNNYMYNVGVSIKETPDGGYVIVGPSYRTFPNGSWSSEIVITKTDNSGNVLWSKTPINGVYTFGYSVDNTIDGGFIISGKAANPNNYNGNVYLIKTNSVGDTLWTKLYDSLRYGFGETVKQTSDSGYIVTGQISYSNSPPKLFLLKTDKDGNTAGLPNTIASVKENGFRVFPNPANDQLNIQRDENSKVLLELIDIQGRVIYREENSENLIRIDISKYPTGPYILKIISCSKIDAKLILKRNSR